MRLVALVALVSLLALPNFAGAVTGVDDCTPSTCVKVAKPDGTPPGVMDKTYYVYYASVNCFPSGVGTACGRPLNGAPVGLVGIVYQETNGVGGLQRFPITNTYDADKAVLL